MSASQVASFQLPTEERHIFRSKISELTVSKMQSVCLSDCNAQNGSAARCEKKIAFPCRLTGFFGSNLIFEFQLPI